jgi:antibiotic biosynthesis monooxygenase (ABM) superfamily enzyme
MTIHVAITRRVLPGREEEFKQALRRFLGESFVHGGVHGASMITALPGGDPREIGILRSFDGEAEREAFYESQIYKDWEAYASTVTEGDTVHRKLTGLEAWFRSPSAPPRWKMAVATFAGVYPLSIFLSLTIGPYLRQMPVALGSFFMALSMVALLTWVVMPNIIRIFKPWLHKGAPI